MEHRVQFCLNCRVGRRNHHKMLGWLRQGISRRDFQICCIGRNRTSTSSFDMFS